MINTILNNIKKEAEFHISLAKSKLDKCDDTEVMKKEFLDGYIFASRQLLEGINMWINIHNEGKEKVA